MTERGPDTRAALAQAPGAPDHSVRHHPGRAAGHRQHLDGLLRRLDDAGAAEGRLPAQPSSRPPPGVVHRERHERHRAGRGRRQVAAGLVKRKFTVGGISNAPESWYVTQTAVVHYGPTGLDQALLDGLPDPRRPSSSRTTRSGHVGRRRRGPRLPGAWSRSRRGSSRSRPRSRSTSTTRPTRPAWPRPSPTTLAARGFKVKDVVQRPAAHPAAGHRRHPLRRGGRPRRQRCSKGTSRARSWSRTPGPAPASTSSSATPTPR